MSAEDLVTQKRWGTRTRFKFGEDKLEFGVRDSSGETTSSQFYNDINLENQSTVKVNVAWRFYIVIMVVGVFAALILLLSDTWLRDFAFIPLFVALATYLTLGNLGIMTVACTVLRPANGIPIRIIHDKKHDEILERVKAGWVRRLRKLHLAVNFANDPKREEQKFKWLLDHEVISDAEFQAAIAQLLPSDSASPVDREQLVH